MSAAALTPAAEAPSEYMARGFRLPPTRSGRASLVALDDVDARELHADDLLVEESGAGPAPVSVVASRMGIVDLGEKSGVEPRELCAVVDRKGPAVRP